MVAGNVDTVSWLDVRLASLVARGLPLWLLSCSVGHCIRTLWDVERVIGDPANPLVGGMAGKRQGGRHIFKSSTSRERPLTLGITADVPQQVDYIPPPPVDPARTHGVTRCSYYIPGYVVYLICSLWQGFHVSTVTAVPSIPLGFESQDVVNRL